MCLYPRFIKNRKYTENKKNGGIIPPIKDTRTLIVPIGCQKCIECRKQKSRSWAVRLHEEIRHDKTGKFINFTFSEEELKKLQDEILYKNNKIKGYELDNAVATLATRRFLERWRKKYKKSVKHWFVTELGQNNTERLHIHGILFTEIDNKTITDIWQYGYTWIGRKENGGYVNGETISYIVKYVNKQDKKHPNYNSIILTSAGIGKKYLERHDATLNKYKPNETKETYTTRKGHKLNLPIYYKNKIYTEDEREKLWLEKLDKKERWICGEKIDISKSDKEYYQLLKYYRKKNTELGYGKITNWKQKEYEKLQRTLLKNLKETNIKTIPKEKPLPLLTAEEAFDLEIPF